MSSLKNRGWRGLDGQESGYPYSVQICIPNMYIYIYQTSTGRDFRRGIPPIPTCQLNNQYQLYLNMWMSNTPIDDGQQHIARN